MAELHEIKDTTPNPRLIEMLKTMLKQAENGETRSMFCVLGWDNDDATKAWVMDDRTNRFIFAGGVALYSQDFSINYLAGDKESGFSQILQKVNDDR